MTTNKNSKKLLRLVWFLLLKDSPTTVPIYPMNPTPVKKPSARKSLYMFSNVLDVNKKTAYRRFGAAKYKHKAIKYVNKP